MEKKKGRKKPFEFTLLHRIYVHIFITLILIGIYIVGKLDSGTIPSWFGIFTFEMQIIFMIILLNAIFLFGFKRVEQFKCHNSPDEAKSDKEGKQSRNGEDEKEICDQIVAGSGRRRQY
ncbi:MAG: hypothetical protein U9R75_12175 [Candidatus Thermoplasmatota archaeon]|nr:hypothetical protein [Candidatus Thermoplasmatota archaeon]